MDEDFYSRLRVEEGIQRIAPVVEGYVRINDVTIQVLGVDLFAERQLRTATSSVRSTGAGGQTGVASLIRGFLTRPGAVLMSQQTATTLELEPGDMFLLAAGGREYPASYHATLDGGQASALDNLFVADIATCADLAGQCRAALPH